MYACVCIYREFLLIITTETEDAATRSEHECLTSLSSGVCRQTENKNRITIYHFDRHMLVECVLMLHLLLTIRSVQNHIARHCQRGKKMRQTEEEVGRQHQGVRQAWSSPSPTGQWRTGNNGENWLQNHLWCPKDPRG